jgi:hypothetical protein
MDWKLSYRLNSDTYAPLQKGDLTNIRIKNISDKKMVVTNVLLRFDWMEKTRYFKECNVKISPNKSADLPDLPFGIHLAAPKGAHKFTPGIAYRLLEDDEWKDYDEVFEPTGDFIEVKSLPKLDFTVFISHSNSSDDKKIVKACRKAMESCGITGYFAEDDEKPGGKLWSKIASKIKTSDAFMVILTEDAANSGDVREEIGIAVGYEKFKKIIPIVQTGVSPSGSLKSLGIEYVEYAPPTFHKPLSATLEILMQLAQEKLDKQVKIK